MNAAENRNESVPQSARDDLDFEGLYERLGSRLLRVARTISCSYADAEDAVQDAFVGLVKLGTALDSVRNIDAYLFTAVHRAAVTRMKQRRRERASAIGALDERVTATEETPLAAEWLQHAVNQLPEEQRTIVALKIDGELTFEQIADVLQINANTAASRYRYALEKLHAALGPRVAASVGHEKGREHGTK